MSIHACILAKVESGRALEAAAHLRAMAAVGMVVATTGPYDLCILARADDPVALGRTVIREFQTIPGMQETLTLLILEALEPVNWMAALASEEGKESVPG